ncbi:hypothetical protein PRK78_006014 [Emydomyces testavorans]|uniref:Uncharacterized protein n=1 Tax=Emydomyces testavorans TaxID=2070801 RepID=A0AAF0DKX9_9EURO|nr:hypothetical protein PRK78_006014 [Emydomyces testavorans]
MDKPGHIPSPSESGSRSTSTSAELDHTQFTHQKPTSELGLRSFSSQENGKSPSDAAESHKPPVIDYQSLPSPPDYGLDLVDDLFGQSVTQAYDISCLRQTWREQMYGMEVANNTRRGWTPSPARRAYAELMEREKRLDELGTDEELSDEEDVSKNGGKHEGSDRSGKVESHNDVNEANQSRNTDVRCENEGPDSVVNTERRSGQSNFSPPLPLTDNHAGCSCKTRPQASVLCRLEDSGQPVAGKQGSSIINLMSTPSPARRHSAPKPTTILKRRRECEESDYQTPLYELEERGRKRFREASVPSQISVDQTSVPNREISILCFSSKLGNRQSS